MTGSSGSALRRVGRRPRGTATALTSRLQEDAVALRSTESCAARRAAVSRVMRSLRNRSASSSKKTQLFPILVPGSSPVLAYCATVSASARNSAATSSRLRTSDAALTRSPSSSIGQMPKFAASRGARQRAIGSEKPRAVQVATAPAWDLSWRRCGQRVRPDVAGITGQGNYHGHRGTQERPGKRPMGTSPRSCPERVIAVRAQQKLPELCS